MNPLLKTVALEQGGVFSRAQALTSGYTRQQLRERVADGRWEKVRYGQYAERTDLSHLAPWDRETWRHRRLAFAVANSIAPGAIALSHQTALVLHGVPLWGVDLTEVQASRLDGRRGGPVAGVRHHRGRFAPSELTKVDGLTVTTLPRALVETACTASFESAVVSADAVLRDHPAEAAVQQMLARIEFWPGSTRAKAALGFADKLSESVGESRLRVLLHNQGLPTPRLQVELGDAAGLVGRVDFFFAEQGTVVEFDGLVKYAGGSPEILVREKLREDRLRALGLEVVRIVWTDLNGPADVAARIRRAFARRAASGRAL
ncbi:type IV toxin-antitoxin system AbiEi family antitoxin domain-containing protein [Kribbella sp. CA-294648]|uniref:type IV toxin-antitoxin system AbiEi family antitoxin domain-containing protein n=1 Tax=Kribbella sp. CA-294648 TaxID=3239948 RepID=UPI003D910579